MRRETFEKIIFEDGDYVRQQCGDILICAGMQNGKYLFHAAMDENGDIHYPGSNFYLYGSIMPGDRLCTDKEMMKINGELMKAGKIFDIVERKLVDSVFKKNPGLFDKFMKDWKKYRSNDNPSTGSGQADNDDEGVHTHWDSRAINLPIPVHSQRGMLKSIHDVAECINVYEARIEELTAMCNEVYDKLKEEQKKQCL